MKQLDNYSSYGEYYSESNLWQKIRNAAQKAGAKIIYAALLLYYVLEDENISWADKAKIYGALGYFILPTDLIPDMIPMLGYTDDLTALLWALKAVRENITPEVKQKARNKLQEWFGNISEHGLKLF